MLKSRPMTTETPKANSRLMYVMKQYATEGRNIPLQKNWSDTWCSLPQEFDKVLEEILDMEVWSDDVFVVTFMKCGTTWMQEAAWLLMNNLDFEKSKNVHLFERSPFIDGQGLIMGAPNAVEISKTLPSPRVIKTHMPANLLPLQIWELKTKIIYVARNCKDVVVSSFHFNKNMATWCGDSFEDYVHDFLNNEIIFTSYWSHIVDFWKMRHEPFIFFTTYEEMKRDLAGVLQRLCAFLDRPQLTPEEVENMLNHLSFDNMKGNEQTNLTSFIKMKLPGAKEEFQFMRRGIVGSYKDELTPELQAKIDDWSRTFLAQHGLTEEDIFGKL